MRVTEKKLSNYPFFVRFIMWAQRVKYGKTLLPALLWGRSPNLLYGLQAFYRAIDRKNSPLEPSLRILLNILVSRINHCDFCVDIGNSLLLDRGVDMNKFMALSEFSTSTLFTERERAALDYADAMTRTNRGVNDIIFSTLKKYFSDDEIIELTALVGYQNLASKFNAALDIPSQGFCQKGL